MTQKSHRLSFRHRQRTSQRLLVVVLLAPALGCAGITERVCTTEYRFGITLSVRDSITRAPAGRGSLITLQSGAAVDTVKETSTFDGPYGLAGERAGVFAITIDKAGYRRWSRTGVQVTAGECHVNGVAVEALLQP